LRQIFKIRFFETICFFESVSFIERLKSKWTANARAAEVGLDFGIAMGDVDLAHSMRNLRHLVTAAYLNKNLENIELVRPLDMTKIYPDVPMPHGNARTNETLYEDLD